MTKDEKIAWKTEQVNKLLAQGFVSSTDWSLENEREEFKTRKELKKKAKEENPEGYASFQYANGKCAHGFTLISKFILPDHSRMIAIKMPLDDDRPCHIIYYKRNGFGRYTKVRTITCN